MMSVLERVDCISIQILIIQRFSDIELGLPVACPVVLSAGTKPRNSSCGGTGPGLRGARTHFVTLYKMGSFANF